MFSRSTLFTWIGIFSLSCMFLMGQGAWAPECTDNDGDGYGSPPSLSCPFQEEDCDDGNFLVHPGVTEGPDTDPFCFDTWDNDCDGAADLDDLGCVPCVDGDGDGYGEQASENCTHVEQDCNDANPNVSPGDPEICGNGVDDDCDGTADNADEDGDGYTDVACGGGDCDDSNANINPGVEEGPQGEPVCADSLDNDCDGDVDLDDSGCSGILPGMVEISGGTFDMGDFFAEGEERELPVHAVTIPTFRMDMHEVTNQEYQNCWQNGEGPCAATGNGPSNGAPGMVNYFTDPTYADYPVLGIDWNEAEFYCDWAGKRLPTEAEWEYAARGGLANKRYPWGDTISGSDANYWNSGDPEDNGPNAVGSYAPNGYGLYDVIGNAHEWVSDWYDAAYYQYCVDNNIDTDPPGPASGTQKVLRGGQFQNTDMRVSVRRFSSLTVGLYIGIRCAAD